MWLISCGICDIVSVVLCYHNKFHWDKICLSVYYTVCICNLYAAKITERQKEVESFIAEDGDGTSEAKMEDSFAEAEGGDPGEMEVGRGRREGSDSGDGSDKEP